MEFPSLLAHHPGEEGESHLFSVGILHVQGVEIHQSLLIEEEKRALYALQKGKPWMVLKKPLKAQHSSDIIQLIEISTKRGELGCFYFLSFLFFESAGVMMSGKGHVT
jgi:hypothetical protein